MWGERVRRGRLPVREAGFLEDTRGVLGAALDAEVGDAWTRGRRCLSERRRGWGRGRGRGRVGGVGRRAAAWVVVNFLL